jgi:glycosyltransferase involved in cell wall biosynthesis
MIRVAAYTGGRDVPSARFRVRQYIPLLQKNDIIVCEKPAQLGAFPPGNKMIRPFWGAAALSERAYATLDSYGYDLTWLQREMVSTLVTCEPFTKRPRILDVDDAIWIYRDGKAARKLAGMCNSVICGNNYLADYFCQWNSNITVIPTGVDTERFASLANAEQGDKIIIGWSGTNPGFQYLYDIERSLAVILEKYPSAVLRIVADSMPKFKLLSSQRIEFIPWSPEIEVQSIQTMTIGIMPLIDSVLARGKCSYKMLTYMACSIPVIVSPIGMNKEILSSGKIGYGPCNEDEWIDAMNALLTNQSLRHQMGRVGREVVLDRFSLIKIAPQIADCIKKLVC